MKKNLYLLSSLLFLSFFSLLKAQSLEEGESCSHKSTAFFGKSRMQRTAIARDPFHVQQYEIELAASNQNIQLSGFTQLLIKVLSTTMDSLQLDLGSSMVVDSVWINQQLVSTWSRPQDVLSIPLSQSLPAGTVFSCKVQYHGTPAPPAGSGNSAAVSSSSSPTWSTRSTWTLSEPFGSAQWFPCLNDLTDKADSVAISIIVPMGQEAGANGLLLGVDTLSGNKLKFKWKSRYPIATYLIAFAVSDYVFYTQFAHPAAIAPDSVLIQNLIYTGVNQQGTACLAFFKPQIDLTADMVEHFSDKFGIYPFYKEKYGHMMARISGGMEHQTMTSLGSFSMDLTSHELGHHWFGDYVTCGTWSDIWLNEGFASYLEYVYRQRKTPGTAANWLSSAQNAASQADSCGTVYVPAGSSEGRIFDSNLSYKKAGCVVHMLRYMLGDSLFFGGIRHYLQQKAFGFATTDNFRQILESYSGIPLTDFVQQWVYGGGIPTYTLQWNYLNGGLFIQSDVHSSCASNPVFSNSIPLRLSLANGQTRDIRIDPTQANQFVRYPDSVVSVSLDPDRWILKKSNSSISKMNNLGVSVPLVPAIDVLIYPNPVVDNLHLEGLEVGSFVRILNIMGQEVKKETANTSSFVLDFSGLPSGTYVVEVWKKQSQMASYYRCLKY